MSIEHAINKLADAILVLAKAGGSQSPVVEHVQTSEAKAEALSYQVLAATAGEYIKANGRDAFKSVLAGFGVDKLNEIPEQRWPEVNSLIGGGR